MRRWRTGLAAQLTLVFVLFAAGLLAALGGLGYANGRASLEAAAKSELLSKAGDIEAGVDAWAAERLLDLTILAASPDLLDGMADLGAAAPGSPAALAAHDQLVRELAAHAGPGRPYLALLVIDPVSAEVIAATNPKEEGKYKETLPFFLNGRTGPYIQNVYYSPALNGPGMTVAAPLRAADGHVLAVLAARLDLGELNALVQRRSSLRQSDEAFLVNSDHLFVTQPRLAPDTTVLRSGLHTEAVNACLTQTSGVTAAPDYRGQPALIAYRWLPAREMCLIVKLDQAEALAPVRAFGQALLLIGGLALLLASAVAVGLAQTLTRPVRALQAAAARFGQGDLTARAPVGRTDELGALAREFNHMAAALAAERTHLRQRVERLYTLSANLIAVVGFDGYLKDFNPAWEQTLGYSPAELLARPLIEFMHPDDQPAAQALGQLATGQPAVDFQVRLQRQDGTSCWVTWNATGDAERQLIYAVGHDITAQRLADEALRESQALLTRSESIARMGSWRWDLVTQQLRWTDGMFPLFGVDPAAFEGNLADIVISRIHPDDRAAVQQANQAVLEHGRPQPMEYRLVLPDATERVVWAEGQLVTDGAGRNVALAGYVLDITARKQVEDTLARQAAELRRSNAELEQFAYVASHDLQEPLRMVSSFVQLLAQRYQGQLDADADEFIGYAVDGANRMKRLISDLLAYSRVGTRGQALTPTASEAALQAAVDNLQAAISDSQAVITHTPLPSVLADHGQLAQLFQNLIGNALKFHSDQPPRVHITAVAQDQAWLFSVADNGIGLDMQYAERIFVIFQRLHGKDQFPGTGIGLAICKKIVERHGGRLWVESQPGQGATFYFTLPAPGSLSTPEIAP